jgi:hypothetical protein
MSESEVKVGDCDNSVPDFNWKEFKYEKLLSNNSNRKVVFILGSCFEKPAIVILEKISFTEEQFSSEKDEDNLIRNSQIEKIFKNDIYENSFCVASANLNSKFHLI